MHPLLRSIYRILLSILLLSLCALIGAYLWEVWGKVPPCYFCLLERKIFALGGLCALLSMLFFQNRQWLQRFLWVSTALWFGASATFLIHLGIQYHILSSPSFCHASPAGTSLKTLFHTPLAHCDTMETLLGLPITLYLLIVCLIFLGACIFSSYSLSRLSIDFSKNPGKTE